VAQQRARLFSFYLFYEVFKELMNKIASCC
jgi:hypothetical protein